MKKPRSEREYLDQQEALARAGIERAVRGVATDVMDIFSVPEELREHEWLEPCLTAAAQALGSQATLELIESALVSKARGSGVPLGILRRVCLESLSTLASERNPSSGR